MRKLAFLIFLFLMPSVLHAESYAIKKNDGTVVIANYFPGSNDTLEDFLRANGLDKLPRIPVKASDIPSKADREFWDISGGRVVVDSEKKQAALDAKTEKEQERDAVLSKLKISKDDYEKLNVAIPS